MPFFYKSSLIRYFSKIFKGKYSEDVHPFHLHGHFFRVVSSARLDSPVTVERVKQLDREGEIMRKLDRAPIKDTVKVAHKGYTILRFKASNPGNID